MSKEILRIENLVKSFHTGEESLVILNNLSMSVHEGEKCVIVGKSGSGKSTLLNVIAGLDKCDSGSVFVEGKDIIGFDEKKLSFYRKNFLGLVFQFHYLLKDFTALENVFLPSYMAGTPKKEAMEKASLLIDEVGLTSRKNHLPCELSGGERQRVAVARSLINNPSLILADEPTGNLDPSNAAQIGDLLFSLSEVHKKTLIMVTHDMKIASRGDVRYFITDGKLSEAEE